ncbi:MAG: hypothetical protein QM680_05510 [Luteolibacter sp.]
MLTGRYFEGDHPALVDRLENHFRRVRASFESHGFEGSLVLGGGYGRGEGGVMMTDAGPEFSNDLDYFLFHESPDDARLHGWCRQIERDETEVLGIDVEIKSLQPSSIGDASRSMMFADLVAGHVVVVGDVGFLKQQKESLDFSRIEPEEATRLLWNRGSGLFFSRCRMGKNDQMGFVIRNHAKVKLALGDAWLCLHGKYTSRCRERAAALAMVDLPEALGQLRAWHAEGVDFKFNPFASGPTWEELEKEAKELTAAWGRVFLAAEGKRLGRTFENFSSYFACRQILKGDGTLKNMALALRDKLKRGAWLKPLGDYPRAALMRALPCLLDLTPGGVAEARRFLPPPASGINSPRDWEATYTKWWTYYA